MQTLCLAKLNATLPEEEIQSCYYLKDGNIKLTLANLSLTSAFNKMVKNPDAEREKDKPVFQLHADEATEWCPLRDPQEGRWKHLPQQRGYS